MITIFDGRYDVFEEQLEGVFEAHGVPCTVKCSEQIERDLATIETNCYLEDGFVFYDVQYIPLDSQETADDCMQSCIKNVIATVLTHSLQQGVELRHVIYGDSD